jgi:hypothetical protein
MLKVPGGTRSISMLVPLSRTRQGNPVAMIALRKDALVTTAGFGLCSSTVHDQLV